MLTATANNQCSLQYNKCMVKCGQGRTTQEILSGPLQELEILPAYLLDLI